MKNRLRAGMKLAAALFVGLLLCMGVYYFVDTVLNGAVVDWFWDHCMRISQYHDENTGILTYVQEPDWYLVKEWSLAALVAVVTVGILAIAIAFFVGRERERDKVCRLQEEMERKEELIKIEAGRKNDLITYLAHDLKTPLTSVIGYLSLLDEIPEMPMQQRAKYVSITLDKAKRLEKLINEFFEITRYNFQNIVLEKEQVDLNYLLLQLTEEFYPILTANGNEIHLEAEEDLSVYGDPEKLARVFNNILKNAVAYSYPGTPILVAAGRGTGVIWLTFTNQGPTIPPQKLDVIFEKFFRLDEARATNSGGAGLGLAIAREIVTLHGGTITAVSQKEKTEFRVELPA